MRSMVWILSIPLALGGLPAAAAATDEQVHQLLERLEALEREQAALKAKLQEMQESETARAAAQEQEAARAVAKSPPPTPSSKAITSGTAFNPQASVILDGNYYNDDVEGEGTELLGNAFYPGRPGGHGHGGDEGHAHGQAERGFNLRETELNFSATVDPYFDAWATIAVDEDDIETEEAYFATRGLPAGLRLKAGKFFSDIGYINRQHPHQWDFTDQNLAYQNLFGGINLVDTGAQLTWLPDWPMYTLFGVEALQGKQERFGRYIDDETERAELNLSDRDEGPRLFTGFVKVAPEIGYSHALQLGGWVAHNQQDQAIIDDELGERGLEGDATMWGADLVYKYDSPRGYGAGDWQLQAEYLYQTRDLEITAFEARPEQVGSDRKFKTDGLYIQGRYGIAPRWQVGLRYDVFGLTNKVEGLGADLDFDESDRWTAMLTWRPSEFSTFRLQAATADILTDEDGNKEDFSYLYLQYILSLGTHGAHKF